jgi:hypothetical protein
LNLWKITNEDDAVLIPKRKGLNHRIFTLVIFWRWVSRYAATPLIVALSPGRSDITSFLPWSPITTGNYLDRSKRKNFQSCSDDWHRWLFNTLSGISTPLRGDIPNVQIFMNDVPNSLT